MILRHIDPGSEEWLDATDAEAMQGEGLTAEQQEKLKRMVAAEKQIFEMPNDLHVPLFVLSKYAEAHHESSRRAR